MRLPWVSRAMHEALMAAKQNELERAEGARIHAESRYDALMMEHRAFVALVAERTAPAPKPVPVTQRSDPVAEAIAHKAAGNGALRAHLFRFAAEARSRGASESDIVRRVTDWSQPADVESSERDKREAEAVVADLLG